MKPGGAKVSGTRWAAAVAIAVVVIILVVASLYLRLIAPRGAPGEIATADGRDYFDVVHAMLSAADKSVDVILYQSRFYFEYPVSRSNILITDLAGAAERGVRVRTIVEAAEWNLENSEDNREVWDLLAGAGVHTYFDPVATTSHSKLVVVDGRYTVVGSTNWSYYSLDKNNEATVVVDSERIAARFAEYFESILKQSSTVYAPPVAYVGAEDVSGVSERYVLLRDLVDSVYYDPPSGFATLYMKDITVRVEDDAMEEMRAVDPGFFDKARGETVRVFASLDRNQKSVLGALDLEMRDTPLAKARAFTAEKAKVAGMTFPKPGLKWSHAPRVVPVPNEAYAREVLKLLAQAKQRIWVAMLDVRFYESRPATARSARRSGGPPSLTNLVLGELERAAARGVDVRLVVDMGRGGSPPETKTVFLDRLRQAGGKVYGDSPDVTTHSKVLVVDGDFTVVGSTNWTYHALEENNETAVIVESSEVNAHYAEFIDGAIKHGETFRDGDG